MIFQLIWMLWVSLKLPKKKSQGNDSFNTPIRPYFYIPYWIHSLLCLNTTGCLLVTFLHFLLVVTFKNHVLWRNKYIGYPIRILEVILFYLFNLKWHWVCIVRVMIEHFCSVNCNLLCNNFKFIHLFRILIMIKERINSQNL